LSILSSLQNIFEEVFDDPNLRITPETASHEIPEWDSVAQVKLVLSVEETFGIRLSSDEVTTIHSVGDFIRAIQRYKGENARS
jgi:acyl carrier protein